MNSEEAEETQSRRRFGRKKIALAAIMLVLILGGVFLYKRGHTNPIPADIKSQVGFTTYYPSDLPDNWNIDVASYSVDTNILFYKLIGPKTTVVISVQARPRSLNINTIYESQMKNVTQFDTPLGDGAIGTTGTRLVGSMLGNDSWVLLSPTSSNITQHELRQIIMALRS